MLAEFHRCGPPESILRTTCSAPAVFASYKCLDSLSFGITRGKSAFAHTWCDVRIIDVVATGVPSPHSVSERLEGDPFFNGQTETFSHISSSMSAA
jgi:hypothetical protein